MNYVYTSDIVHRMITRRTTTVIQFLLKHIVYTFESQKVYVSINLPGHLVSVDPIRPVQGITDRIEAIMNSFGFEKVKHLENNYVLWMDDNKPICRLNTNSNLTKMIFRRVNEFATYFDIPFPDTYKMGSSFWTVDSSRLLNAVLDTIGLRANGMIGVRDLEVLFQNPDSIEIN